MKTCTRQETETRCVEMKDIYVPFWFLAEIRDFVNLSNI